jgi:hypothetical protein
MGFGKISGTLSDDGHVVEIEHIIVDKKVAVLIITQTNITIFSLNITIILIFANYWFLFQIPLVYFYQIKRISSVKERYDTFK